VALKELNENLSRPLKVIHTDTAGQLGSFESEAVRLANVNHVDSLLPLVFIARVAGYDPARQSVRHSFGRAARRLQARGLIDLYTVDVATATGLHGPTNYRAVLCACRPGLTAPDGHAAQTMGELAYRPVAG